MEIGRSFVLAFLCVCIAGAITDNDASFAVIEAISGALNTSSRRQCKAWDHKKCMSIDYQLSYENRTVSLTYGTPCSQEGRSHYSILEWKSGGWTVPSCIQYVERGLVIFSKVRIPSEVLERDVLPSLLSCCSMSFDAVSSFRLRRSVMRLLDDTPIGHDWHTYFFVRDECILSISETKRKSKANSDFGIMMCSNLRFLGTAKTAIDVISNEGDYEIDVILPDEVVDSVPQNYFEGSSVSTNTVHVPGCILQGLTSEYGFRMHKLPMLLQGQHDNNLYLDSDVYTCGPNAIRKLRTEMNEKKNASVFCMREGVRAVDRINYVHGGVLGWRAHSSLALAFMKTWLRLYIVHYQHSSRRGKGSIYEQPSLTLTADNTQSVVGKESVHFWDSDMLLRSHLHGGLQKYRNNLGEKGYAADLVHINPLKQWNLVDELVVRAGCANFTKKSLKTNLQKDS